MFKYYKYLIPEYISGKRYYKYRIVDTDFECEISMPSNEAGEMRAIIDVYQARNLSVAKNLALYFTPYYHTAIQHRISAERGAQYLDHYFPALKYSEKYHRCVLNQIKKLEYIGRK